MNWVILNFDLGLKGDYESLYKFLDNQKAIDCGNSNCVFEFNFKGQKLDYSERFEQIKTELESRVVFSKGDRIYVIVHNDNDVPRGKFIIGQRKTPIWDGYGDKEEDDDLPF